MRIYRFLVVVLFLLPGAPSVFGQNENVRHYTFKDGLPSNHVYRIFQDSKGFIWFSTDNGLSRFDGREFKNFDSKDGIPDNDIFDMAEDVNGKLWLICFNGKLCYINNARVYTALNDSNLKVPVKGNYFNLFPFGKQIILREHISPDYYLIDKEGRLSPGTKVNFLCVNVGNYLVCGPDSRKSDYTVAHFDLFDDKMRVTDSIKLKPPFIPKSVTTINLSHENPPYRFAILFDNLALRYDVENGKFRYVDSIRFQPGITTYWNLKNELWYTKENSAILPMNPDFTADITRDTLFKGKQVWHIIKDREGNYWGSTPGSGVYMLPNNGFRYHKDEELLKGDMISALDCYKNQIFAGYNSSAIKRLNDNKVLYRNHVSTTSFRKKIIYLSAQKNEIFAFDADEMIQVNTANGTSTISEMAFVTYKHILPLGNDSAIFCTASNCFAKKPGRPGLVTIYNSRSTCALARKNGEVLVGTLKGIYRCVRNNQNKWISELLLTVPKMETYRIAFIKELDNMIIAGTVQNGLIIIKDNDYEKINLGDLNEVNCKRLFIAGDKTLWLATFSGLYRIKLSGSIHDYTVQRISEFNGLPANDVTDVVVVKDSVYLACPGYLCSFSIKYLDLPGKKAAPLYVTDVIINSRSYQQNGNTLELPPDSNNVEIKFAALDYKSLGNIIYKYRLGGLNNKWQSTLNNFVRFESLPPGDYNFELMAMNNQDIWTTSPLSFTITIRPHWWQSVWFRVLFVVLIISVIVGGLRFYFKQKNKKELQKTSFKKQLIEVELKAIKAQINPHFIFNTLNAVLHFISQKQNEEAEDYMTKLARLVRKTLDFSNRTFVTLKEEIEYLETYLQLESLRFDTDFKYEIINNLDNNEETPELPPMVLQPHIENALRHGLKNKETGPKLLQVKFDKVGKSLQCEIKDNGVGRAAVKALRNANSINHISVGLELSHSKLRVYEQLTGKKVNTQISDLYEHGTKTAAGTLITVTIEQ